MSKNEMCLIKKINKIVLSLDDNRMQSIDLIETCIWSEQSK